MAALEELDHLVDQYLRASATSHPASASSPSSSSFAAPAVAPTPHSTKRSAHRGATAARSAERLSLRREPGNADGGGVAHLVEGGGARNEPAFGAPVLEEGADKERGAQHSDEYESESDEDGNVLAAAGWRPALASTASPLAHSRLMEYHPGGGPSSGHRHRSVSTGATDLNPAYRRICLWANRKHYRMERQRQEAVERELAECSFAPNTNQSTTSRGGSCSSSVAATARPSPLYKDNIAWGTGDFIARYAEARQRKEEQRRYEEEFWSSPGSRWRPAVTIPEPFELGRPVKLDIKALKTPYKRMASAVRELQGRDSPSTIEPPSLPAGVFSMKSSTAILQHSPAGGEL